MTCNKFAKSAAENDILQIQEDPFRGTPTGIKKGLFVSLFVEGDTKKCALEFF